VPFSWEIQKMTQVLSIFVELGTNLECFLGLHAKTFVHLTAFENLVPN
jgi:hypothetical protein